MFELFVFIYIICAFSYTVIDLWEVAQTDKFKAFYLFFPLFIGFPLKALYDKIQAEETLD